MSRVLLYTVLACALAPLNAFAVWEYSVAAHLAMYDATEHRCGRFDPGAFEKTYANMLLVFTAEEQSELTKVRQSAEYREVLAEVNEELAKDIAEAGEDGEAKVCKQIIQNL